MYLIDFINVLILLQFLIHMRSLRNLRFVLEQGFNLILDREAEIVMKKIQTVDFL